MFKVKLINFGIGFCTLLVTLSLQPCMVTIYNDTTNPVLIVAQDHKEAVLINQNQTKNFGNQHKHANFYVMPEVNAQTYQPTIMVTQKACTHGKHINLNISDMLNKKLSNWFFAIDTIQ